MAIPTSPASAADDKAGSFNLAVHAVYQSVRDMDPWRSCLALMANYFQAASASLMVRSCAARDPGYLLHVPAGAATEWYERDPFID